MTNKTQDRDFNTGILGKNNKKEQPSHPDSRGRANVGGLWYWVSGWTKESKSDPSQKFSSLAFTLMTQDDVDKYVTPKQQDTSVAPKEQPKAAPKAASQTSSQEGVVDIDDDIPF